MILDTEITLVASSKIMGMLRSIGIIVNYKDLVTIPIDKLWSNSNYKINVKCDICGNEKKLSYTTYNKNIKKHYIYTCNNSCASIKNKMTCSERYNDINYNNIEKVKETKILKYNNANFNNREKARKTNLERYGDANYNNRDKFKETSLEKYGVINPLLNDNIKEKSKNTNLEKYGVEDSRSSDYVKKKRRKTNLQRYGVELYVNTDEYKEKVKRTSLERYGVDSPNKVQFIKDKKVKSMLNKYVYTSNSITEDSKEKLRNTNLQRYGVEYPMQLLEFCEKQQKNSKKIIYYNDILYYQSSYERDFLLYVDKLGLLDFIKRGPTIQYNFNGIIKTHYPDFYIDNYNLIVEIKSDYYYKKYLDLNIAKMEECIRLGYNYLYIINKNYNIFNNILKNKYF
jgi:hypothetical protein